MFKNDRVDEIPTRRPVRVVVVGGGFGGLEAVRALAAPKPRSR